MSHLWTCGTICVASPARAMQTPTRLLQLRRQPNEASREEGAPQGVDHAESGRRGRTGIDHRTIQTRHQARGHERATPCRTQAHPFHQDSQQKQPSSLRKPDTDLIRTASKCRTPSRTCPERRYCEAALQRRSSWVTPCARLDAAMKALAASAPRPAFERASPRLENAARSRVGVVGAKKVECLLVAAGGLVEGQAGDRELCRCHRTGGGAGSIAGLLVVKRQALGIFAARLAQSGRKSSVAEAQPFGREACHHD